MKIAIIAMCFAALSPIRSAEVAEVSIPGALSARVWTDDESGDSVLVARIPAPSGANEVRDQAAGFIEGPIHSGYFVPDSAGGSSFAGLPSLYMRGRLVKDDRVSTAIYTIAFASDCSYVITAVSSSEPSSAVQEAEILETTKPLDGAAPIVDEIGPKLSNGIGEFTAMAEKIVAAQKIKDKRGEPGATDNPDGAQ